MKNNWDHMRRTKVKESSEYGNVWLENDLTPYITYIKNELANRSKEDKKITVGKALDDVVEAYCEEGHTQREISLLNSAVERLKLKNDIYKTMTVRKYLPTRYFSTRTYYFPDHLEKP